MKQLKNIHRNMMFQVRKHGLKIHKPWVEFSNFEMWALKNGYVSGHTRFKRISTFYGYTPDNVTFVWR